ncbi:MAG: SET domain-containing protein-lysine N-methyltransferase [Planctomycetes bacterium]|nr:SET domain-containing protein-lysine N-methyltransferase [Planctomycetota bacterium]
MSTANPWVIVGKVPYGKGVFARKRIPEGTDIGLVVGKVINDPDYASAYCIDLGNNLSLEPRTPFRYLNHRCEPNAALHLREVVYEDGTPAPSEVYLEALTEIHEGTELTIDYQWSADGAIKCLCGANLCRGWVVAAEELPALLKSHKPKQRRSRSTASASKSTPKPAGTKSRLVR